jgi:hypothetical protein
MSNLEKVSWDNLRMPLPSPPSPTLPERWERVKTYADTLESVGTISPTAKLRLLKVMRGFLLYRAVLDEIDAREPRFNQKISNFVWRVSRKIR